MLSLIANGTPYNGRTAATGSRSNLRARAMAFSRGTTEIHTGSVGPAAIFSYTVAITSEGIATPDLYNSRKDPRSSCIVQTSFLNVTSRCPAETSAPAAQFNISTVPALGAETEISIFMASNTISFCPAATRSPASTATFHTLAVTGEHTGRQPAGTASRAPVGAI